MKKRACWLNQTKLNGGWTCGYRPVDCYSSHKIMMNKTDFDNCRAPVQVNKIPAKNGKPQDFKQRPIDREKLARDGGGEKGGKGGKKGGGKGKRKGKKERDGAAKAVETPPPAAPADGGKPVCTRKRCKDQS